MYNCGVCGKPSEPGTPCKKQCIKRTNGEISKEVKLCEECYELVETGVPLQILLCEDKVRKPVVTSNGPRILKHFVFRK